jgi:hypothetical protein
VEELSDESTPDRNLAVDDRHTFWHVVETVASTRMVLDAHRGDEVTDLQHFVSQPSRERLHV